VEATDPYTPPTSELEVYVDPQVVWRNGDLIVMQKGADMPGRCVLCNDAAEPAKPRRILYLNIWLQIAMLLLFLAFNVLALLPILIVSMIFRKTARVRIPVCAAHRRQRLWITLGTVALLLAAISTAVVAARAYEFQGPLFIAAVVIFVAAFGLAILRGQLLRAKRIDGKTVILKGAKPPYLDSLPRYPGP
jgi:hypothetical protein